MISNLIIQECFPRFSKNRKFFSFIWNFKSFVLQRKKSRETLLSLFITLKPLFFYDFFLNNQKILFFSLFRALKTLFLNDFFFKTTKNYSGSYRSFPSLYVDLGLSYSTRSFRLVYQQKHCKGNFSTFYLMDLKILPWRI